MNTAKGYNSKPYSTKRYKLDRVAPVDNRPPMIRMGAPNSGGEGIRKQKNPAYG